jgi:hypothetical protein
VVWILDGAVVGLGGNSLNIGGIAAGSGSHTVFMSAVRAGVDLIYSNSVDFTR